MQLIGMLDSPYVRRVAIALLRLGLPFEHKPVSLFRHIDAYRAISPTLKAPTLVADDGSTLVDSGLIIDYAQLLAPEVRLLPDGVAARLIANRRIGLALVVNEKGVQLHYERMLRPPEKRHAPWVERVQGQLDAALAGLEAELGAWRATAEFMLPEITLATAFAFTQMYLPDNVDKARYPRIAAFCKHAETLPEFLAAPAEDSVVVKGRAG
jgi:glutathione S-transferase